MTAWKHPLACWAFTLCCATQAFAQISAQLTSRHLARGEQAFLEISLPGRPPDALPVIPAVKDVTIKPVSPAAVARPMPGRRIGYFYQYSVESYGVGSHTIPPVEVMINGLKSRTEPIEFVVFNPDELQWREVVVGGRKIRYAADFRILKDRPYEGEASPTEIKIFVPAEVALTVEDWGIPEFERDGVACWRLEPSSRRSQLYVNGKPYVSAAYPSTLTPTRSGKVGIGPAKVRLTTTQVVFDGFPQRVNEEIFLEVPKLEFETKPLPAGAPVGFENAIGSFSIRANANETEVREGDPIAVDVFVTGSGNLDTLRPPRLQDPKDWKIYEATATQRGDERRQHSGSIIFQQLIKPLALQTSIPPFQLVYFDPVLTQYRTITSAAIPLKILPSSKVAAPAPGQPQALPVPIEQMNDILSILRPASLVRSGDPGWPWWSGHAFGALVALALTIRVVWLRLVPRLRRTPAEVAGLRALKELARTPGGDAAGFLRNAGAFIEKWLGDDPDEALRAILAERDATCFRAEKPAVTLGNRRHEILRTLRKAILRCILVAGMLMVGMPGASAAAVTTDTAGRALAAYESANYDEAINLWLSAGGYEQLSPDVLYNIGNACYRLGSAGHAALYYRRALARDPGHEESRQNLRFIERKCGSLTVQRPEYQYALAKVPLNIWRAGVWTGAWLCLIALLVFPATRNGARVRIVAITMLIIAPLLAAIGLLGWHYYPDDSEFAPVANQAVIIADKVVLHSDAARTSPEVIDAPPGSLCQVIRLSGDWAYIAFATKTRGWLPASAIEKIIPGKPLTPPKIRKPVAGDRAA